MTAETNELKNEQAVRIFENTETVGIYIYKMNEYLKNVLQLMWSHEKFSCVDIEQFLFKCVSDIFKNSLPKN